MTEYKLSKEQKAAIQKFNREKGTHNNAKNGQRHEDSFYSFCLENYNQYFDTYSYNPNKKGLLDFSPKLKAQHSANTDEKKEEKESSAATTIPLEQLELQQNFLVYLINNPQNFKNAHGFSSVGLKIETENDLDEIASLLQQKHKIPFPFKKLKIDLQQTELYQEDTLKSSAYTKLSKILIAAKQLDGLDELTLDLKLGGELPSDPSAAIAEDKEYKKSEEKHSEPQNALINIFKTHKLCYRLEIDNKIPQLKGRPKHKTQLENIIAENRRIHNIAKRSGALPTDEIIEIKNDKLRRFKLEGYKASEHVSAEVNVDCQMQMESQTQVQQEMQADVDSSASSTDTCEIPRCKIQRTNLIDKNEFSKPLSDKGNYINFTTLNYGIGNFRASIESKGADQSRAHFLWEKLFLIRNHQTVLVT